ncbi:transcription factor grauzone-like [Anopheles ziemanni]|uniref:transcription factor grauzone-like n=1 Tax=Anopheles ziemanni TaxID=345580 RepID=UPI00265B2268|nr:transcription factor grauzone-like isoform X1 [Anopheles coustani]XP_058124512.1 transcription factor grauzone-like isoform X1 [Anopheles coustani]XP_058124513.1 transcription factor grauzone-like isoform X1 [Anopheles coustani]XP_058166779.1 transcription factor grauzone-like [Anopheles ziemanni]XP_058166781.1 transcription factor grauzone-like [Anopheles ziemanni]
MELVRLLSVCRLCLKHPSNYSSIFSDESLMKKIAYVFQFPVQQFESLSTVICSPCLGTVVDFAEYAERVGQNQAYLKLLVDKIADRSIKQLSAASHINTTVTNEQECDLEEAVADQEDPEVIPVVSNVSETSSKVDGDLVSQYLGFHCEVCDKKLDSFQALKEHCRVTHKTVARVSCCGKRFTRKDRLHTHILNHVQPDAFKCETCSQVCKTKATLQAHRKQHLSPEERPYHCTRCEQRFVSRSQLTNHEFTHVPIDQRKHVCPQCAKAFAFRYSLARHMKVHSQHAKEFVCEICAKSYSTQVGLKQHLIDHETAEGALQPRVQCTVCHQSYKNRDTLRLHVRDKHKSAGVHFCETCEKDFPTKNKLATHIKYVHVRNVRYPCKVCGAAFRRRVELREHATRHTGKALYECNDCGQTFNHSSNYSTHRKNKHKRQERINNERQNDEAA